MFLAAVARPRYVPGTRKFFDGKIGIWPIVEKVKAKRGSKNRPKGTPVTQNVEINRDRYRDYLRDKVFPAIREKWPDRNARVIVQQDNARPHVPVDDPEILALGSRPERGDRGIQIEMRCQPPNSPDLNVLDLGFFNSIQSLQDKIFCKDIDSLIQATEKAFEDQDKYILEKVWLSLAAVMELIMENSGSNDFKLPHLKKDSRYNAFPIYPPCNALAVNKAKSMVKEQRAIAS